MKKLFIGLCLLAGMTMVSTNSFAKKQPVGDSLTPPTTSDRPSDVNFNSNIDSLVRMQNERRAKQKKDAMIRIGIGVAMLAVLVIGLSRRKKK
jgi:hypothetical protein